MSLDGGKTWTGCTGSHTDYHAFWINPKDPRIVAVGHDGGVDISNDGGFTWDYHNDIAVGQFYQVSADMRRPYYVCGGLQDNNAWCGPSALRSNSGPVNTDWFTVAGGDGFYTRQDPTDWAIVYGESQDGNMSRHDLRTGTQKSIRPNAGPGRRRRRGSDCSSGAGRRTRSGAAATPPDEARRLRPGGRGAAGSAGAGAGGGRRRTRRPAQRGQRAAECRAFRFYWNAPFEISPHNPAVIYMAAQYFFKSNNRGDTWWMNPKDLSKNVNRWAPEMAIMGVAGDKPMAEKHDGYCRQFAGHAGSRISVAAGHHLDRHRRRQSAGEPGRRRNLHQRLSATSAARPRATCRSRASSLRTSIPARPTSPSTTIATTIGSRTCSRPPTYGKTWTNVAGNLPAKGNINALREDYDNPNLLFVGTEFGLYVTLDGGKEWKKFMTGLPSVRVDDILIHPRDRDLIVGDARPVHLDLRTTSAPLEQMKTANDGDVVLFDPRPAMLWKNDPQAQRHADQSRVRGRESAGRHGHPDLGEVAIWARARWSSCRTTGGQHHGCDDQGGHEPVPVADDRSRSGRAQRRPPAVAQGRADAAARRCAARPRSAAEAGRPAPTREAPEAGGGGGGRDAAASPAYRSSQAAAAAAVEAAVVSAAARLPGRLSPAPTWSA